MRYLPIAAVVIISSLGIFAWAQSPNTATDGRMTPEQAEGYMRGFAAPVDQIRMKQVLTASNADLSHFIQKGDPSLAAYAIQEAERRKTPAFIPALGKRMRNQADSRAAARAADALGLYDTPEARSLLHQGISDRRLDVRTRAAISLARFGDRAAIPALRAGLTLPLNQASVPTVKHLGRTHILSAGLLGKFRDTASVPLLIRMAEPAYTADRRHICKPLAEMGTPAALRKLEQMATQEEYSGTRALAVRELGKVAKKANLPTFLKALNDKSSQVRYEAVLAIERIGDPSAKSALEKAVVSQAPDEQNTGYGRRTRQEATRVLNQFQKKAL